MEKNDPQIIGPVCVWEVEDFPRLYMYINASYSSKQATNSTKGPCSLLGQDWTKAYNDQNSISFDIKADGLWHVYLAQVSMYTDLMYGLQFHPIPAGIQGSYVKLLSYTHKFDDCTHTMVTDYLLIP